MKTYIFHRENNNFDDVLKDKNVKKYVIEQYQFDQHLIIRVDEDPKVLAYITLMFSEELKNMKDLVPDRTPIMNVDYIPKNKKRV